MKRIKLIICFSFILFSMQLNAQNRNLLDSMINESILQYVKISNEYIKSGASLNKIDDFSGVYIMIEKFPEGFEFSSEVKSKGFKTIHSFRENRKLFKKMKSVLIFWGPYIYENRIIISLGRTSVKLKNRVLNISASGPVICTWEYSQEAEKWVLIDVEDAGI